MNSAIRYTFFIFWILLLGTSCGTLKHLEEGETLLRKNKVTIKDKKNVDDYSNLRYELGSKVFQKPNTRFLGLPGWGPWYFYRYRYKADKNWWTRFVMKNLAEEPAVYSFDLADASAKNMESYMRQRGYFDAQVEFETKKKGLRKKKTEVRYTILPGQRYYFDTVQFISKDTAIYEILQAIKRESFLKKGGPVDGVLHEQEKRRITNHLKNSGYANFYINYIPDLVGDSTGNIVNADLEVLLTKDSTTHKKYQIGDVSIISLYDENGNPILTRDTIVNGTRFYVGEGRHYIKLRALEREVFMKKGDLYQVSNIDKTRVQLRNLDIFQFVDIRRMSVSPTDSILDYEIRLIPRDRMEIGTNFEINSSRSVASNAFVGTTASLSYRNRNFFRGGEVFTAQIEGGVEVIPRRSIKDFEVNAWNLNLVSNMDFPRYFDILKTDWLWTRSLLGKGNKFYSGLKERGVSTASVRYNILSNQGSYRIDIFAGAFGWRFRPSNRLSLTVNKVGIDFLDPVLDPEFDSTYVQANPFLQRSLTEQLFTGFFFRDINLVYRRDIGFSGKSSWFARGNLEISGLEVAGVNAVRNAFSANEISFKLFDKYDFSHYVRLEGDLRYYRNFEGGRLLAARANVGIAADYLYSDDVPYVKQFFVGGPTSLRGWRIRELGPGGYIDPNPPDATNYYQTGDFKLEMNMEYRFNFLPYFKGAIFLDIGNVWALDDDQRPNSGFSNFFNEFAISSGFGIRLDVEYFVVRSDFGYKLRNPFPDEDTGKYWLVNSTKDLALNNFVWQLAVGYPF